MRPNKQHRNATRAPGRPLGGRPRLRADSSIEKPSRSRRHALDPTLTSTIRPSVEYRGRVGRPDRARVPRGSSAVVPCLRADKSAYKLVRGIIQNARVRDPPADCLPPQQHSASAAAVYARTHTHHTHACAYQDLIYIGCSPASITAVDYYQCPLRYTARMSPPPQKCTAATVIHHHKQLERGWRTNHQNARMP